MSALTPSQQATIRHAREALAVSRQLDSTAIDGDLHRNTGRLEIALQQALRVIDELTEAS